MTSFNLNSRDGVTPRARHASPLRRTALAACGAAALALLSAPAAAVADDCPNAAIRAAQGSTHLPDCRAYEWISWDNRGGNVAGVDSIGRPAPAYARADGDRFMFFGSAVFGETKRGGVNMYHFADRGETGWTARPGATPEAPELIIDSFSSNQVGPVPSADVSQFGFSMQRPLTLGNPPTPSLYLASGGVAPPVWLTRPEPGLAPRAGGSHFVIGGSPDFSVVYFGTGNHLTTQAGDDLRSGMGIYERRDGILRPAAVLPDGTVPAGGIGLAGSNAATSVLDQATSVKFRNQVSRDGNRLFFTVTTSGVTQLYVREDGARTRLLSHALGSPRTPSAAGIRLTSNATAQSGWGYATPSGSHIVFLSTDVLAPGAENAPLAEPKAYRADVATAELTYLPDVKGLPLAMDEDASRILWNERAGELERFHLWDGDRGVAHLLTDWHTATGNNVNWADTTAGGDVWAISTRTPIDPAQPVTNDRRQVYRWALGDATPVPRCISCRPGVAPSGDSNVNNWTMVNLETLTGRTGPGMPATPIAPTPLSADGRRVYFDTREALVDEDLNAERDVYVWEDGRGPRLITTGTSDDPSFFLNATPSGDDIFVTTTAGLVPSDTDDNYDVYDVRVGGGFAEVQPASCEGDGCQPPPGPPASPSAPGSDRLGEEGRGADELAAPPARLGVRRVTRDRTRSTFRITTSSAGTVRITGTRVATVRRTLGKRGSVTVRLRLTRAGRRTLARRGKVAVNVRIRFAPRTGKAVGTAVKTTITRQR